MKKYKITVSGGTFDHLHKGHKEFINFQLDQSEKILLGVTTDKFARKLKKGIAIESYDIRKSAIKAFLKAQKVESRVEIIPIDTPHIPLHIEKYPIDAIVVTKDSYKGAVDINVIREKNGMKPLKIVEFAIASAQDGAPISSTRIRRGDISRDGDIFVKTIWFKKSRNITQVLRAALKKPFGNIVGSDYDFTKLNPQKIITVGDIATKTMLLNAGSLKGAVVDFVVERKKTFTNIRDLGFLGSEKIIKVTNPAGQIAPQLFYACKEMLDENERKNSVIVVDGEEDLAVLPVLLISPLGYSIFYGQPKKGLVEVLVTEEVKKSAFSLVNMFRSE